MSSALSACALPPVAAPDVERLRADFPILRQRVHGQPLVYLDSAATAHKPQAVIDAIVQSYAAEYSNVHRGVHRLSELSTAAYEGAREKIRAFINARSTREIIFLRGTTEAINLIATSFGRSQLKAGDEILVTAMEHHSDIVPWQLLCKELGTVLKVAPMDERGELIMEDFERLLGPRTRLVGVVHVSNSLGTVNPVRRIVELAHAAGARVLIDGAQAVPHLGVDVQALDCDFYAFSGHKLYGPTGIGVLYGKESLLDAMPPYHGGGDMIRQVSFECSTYAGLPFKFEAGTPHIAGAIGLGAAVDYVQAVGLRAIERHEQDLLDYATAQVQGIPGVRLIGTAREKAGILSFVIEGVHAHDIGTILDRSGIAVRAGHHCCMPVMKHYCVPATTRASFALYNTRVEIDALVAGIHRIKEVFG